MKPLYTIGYGRLRLQDLRRYVDGLETVLIDCRARPFSRRWEFGFRNLQKVFGDRYELHGHHLGGAGGGGRILPSGLAFIRQSLKKRSLLLMCQCEAPGECHRLEISKHFPRALHIFRDQLIEAREFQRSLDENRDYLYEDFPLYLP
jgi:hypothetical protein